MKNRISLFVTHSLLIFALFFSNCKEKEEETEVVKTITNNQFEVFEKLNSEFYGSAADTFFENAKVEIKSNYPFESNWWFINGVQNDRYYFTFEHRPLNNDVIAHRGFYSLKENLIHDATLFEKKLTVIPYRIGESADSRNLFDEKAVKYMGEFTYLKINYKGSLIIKDTILFDGHWLVANFNDDCLTQFQIFKYGYNCFYSDSHNSFNCNGKTQAKMFGELKNDSLKLTIKYSEDTIYTYEKIIAIRTK